MTETKDIVKELDAAEVPFGASGGLRRRAAAEIARLRSEVAELRGALESVADDRMDARWCRKYARAVLATTKDRE